jgi:hypothetical protein
MFSILLDSPNLVTRTGRPRATIRLTPGPIARRETPNSWGPEKPKAPISGS